MKTTYDSWDNPQSTQPAIAPEGTVYEQSSTVWWCNVPILKNMTSSMGRIIYPIYEMDNETNMFETINQINK